jgi:tRNA threonylcarbamoyl adenosine modification protein (Sua5/YciO/YrdC/YwlC family)
MLIKIYPQNPNPKQINKVVDLLNSGGVVIYPTDTVYGIGCGIHFRKAIEKIAQIKGNIQEINRFSLICSDLSQISQYTLPISNITFKLIKRNLPGPFTFILTANNKVPDIFHTNKKTVGVRIPNNQIILEIVKEFGSPVLTTSVHDDDQIVEYITDPELIYEKYKDQVDMVIDGGYGQNIASTIVDCTSAEPVIIRQGIGVLI